MIAKKFIRVRGRVIPILTNEQKTRKIKRIHNQVKELVETKRKVKSPFIKSNADKRINELVKRMQEVMA